jgi:hypothetical protein
MKINSTLMALGLGLASLSLAEAQTNYVCITGSTAARGTVYNCLSTNTFDSAPTIITQTGSGSGATYMMFQGYIGGAAYTVKCDWSGSELGILDVADGRSQQFLNDSAVNGGSGPYVTLPVDLCMADNAQAFSRTPSPVLQNGTEVCVIPFTFVKESGSAADLANVTDQAFQQVASGGATLGLLTGNPADTTTVYLTGRDVNSGTRVNTFGDTGFGIFTTPEQIEVNASGMELQGKSYYSSSGYSGGGSVASQMEINLSGFSDPITGNSSFSVIAYLGISDAKNAIANNSGAAWLTYNGVAESSTAIEVGQYNLWGNEYIYEGNSPSSAASTVFGKLSSKTGGITKCSDGITTIDLNLMLAARTGPTTPPAY